MYGSDRPLLTFIYPGFDCSLWVLDMNRKGDPLRGHRLDTASRGPLKVGQTGAEQSKQDMKTPTLLTTATRDQSFKSKSKPS